MTNRLTMMLGCVAVCVAGVWVGRALAAEQTPAPTAAAAATAGFKEVTGWLARTAELIPADKYAYTPVATVRSAGAMLGHAADGLNWYCARATNANADWSDAVEKGRTDKATIVAALRQATDRCAAVYANPNARIDQLFANVAHANLHYGNLVTYLRMLGLTPPSS